MITAAEARRFFTYRSGQLYWRERPSCGSPVGVLAGCPSGKYRRVKFRGVQYHVRQIVWLLHNEYLPEKIAHLDGKVENCRIENLVARPGRNVPQITKEEAEGLFLYKFGALFWKNAPTICKEPGERAGTWAKSGWRIRTKGRVFPMRKVIWVMHGGRLDATVGHVNGDKFDCRIENLYEVTSEL